MPAHQYSQAFVNQACCIEHLWFLNLAQSSAKSVCEAGLGCVECPG